MENIVNNAFEFGPWQTLSVALVCALVGGMFLVFRNHFARSDKVSRAELCVVHKRIDKLIEKIDILDKKTDKNAECLSYIKGKLSSGQT